MLNLDASSNLPPQPKKKKKEKKDKTPFILLIKELAKVSLLPFLCSMSIDLLFP